MSSDEYDTGNKLSLKSRLRAFPKGCEAEFIKLRAELAAVTSHQDASTKENPNG